MSVVDVDSELLEAFLDGELSEAQAEAVRQRLAIDPVFSHAMDELIAERTTREHFYNTLQLHDSAEDAVVGRLLSSVERSLDQEDRRALARSDRRRMFRYIAAAAACVMFSFSAGWIGHRHASDRMPLGGSLMGDSFVAGPANSNSGVGTLVSNLLGSSPIPSANSMSSGGVDVTLSDSLGHVVAVQHFDSVQEAREFTQDMGRWQQQQQLRQNGNPLGNLSDAVLLKGQF